MEASEWAERRYRCACEVFNLKSLFTEAFTTRTTSFENRESSISCQNRANIENDVDRGIPVHIKTWLVNPFTVVDYGLSKKNQTLSFL